MHLRQTKRTTVLLEIYFGVVVLQILFSGVQKGGNICYLVFAECGWGCGIHDVLRSHESRHRQFVSMGVALLRKGAPLECGRCTSQREHPVAQASHRVFGLTRPNPREGF